MTKHNPEAPRTPVRFTTRAKVLAGALAVIGSVGAVAEGAHLTNEHHEHSRVAYNTEVIKNADTILDGTVTLTAPAHARSTTVVKHNGDPERDEISNAVLTVKPGQELSIVRPIIVKGKDGKSWIAFEKPGTDPQTMEDKAKNLEYVALEQIQDETPGIVSITGDDKSQADARTVSIQSVVTDQGVDFKGARTEFMYGYVGTSQLIPGSGK